jgi:hypothetical protein
MAGNRNRGEGLQMNAKTICGRVTSAWKNSGMFTAVYADGSTIKLVVPREADPSGLVGVCSSVGKKQLVADFAAAGMVIE